MAIKYENFLTDVNVHKDPLKHKSSFEIYEMWVKSAKDTDRSYSLEMLFKRRTGFWIEDIIYELEQLEK